MRWQIIVLGLSVLLSASLTAYGQAFVEHVSPPVFQRGVANRVRFLGKETANPVGLWTSLPSGVMKVQPEVPVDPARGQLIIEPSVSAPLGLYGLRLATRSGLSNLHLCLIDELPVMVRDLALPIDAVVPVALPVCATSICREAVVDRYSITVQKGQRVTFEVVGNRFGKDYDPLVQIRNSSGRLVAECDNSVGLLFDCRFGHTFADEGTYIVEIRDARFEGDPSWHYALRMGDFPEARVSVPAVARIGETTNLSFPQVPSLKIPVAINAEESSPRDYLHEIRLSPNSAATWITLGTTSDVIQIAAEPNDTLEMATTVTVPAVLNGVLDQPGDRDYFAFELVKDQKLRFQAMTASLGSAADLEMVLFDADGREVRRVDDTEQEEASFEFNVGKPGIHRLMVRDVTRDGGPAFTYRIDVRSGGPQIQLFADASDLSIPVGTHQSLPIKVIRSDYAGEIKLELKGCPEGITLESAVIPPGVNEFLGRIIAAPGTSEGIFSLKVVGSGTSDKGVTVQAVAKVKPLVDRLRKNVDQIPYALRPDQRLLPPSLSDQIALMVTPSTPFSAELPEAVVPLTRFQTTDFAIVTTRQAGFTSPITFSVKGGQIGDEQQERDQVFARFLPATEERLTTKGMFFNRINTQLNKHRVDLTASAEVDGRRVNLIRSFMLDVRSAFQPTFEPFQLTTEPGGSVKLKLIANRVDTFDGPVVITIGPQFGIHCPETVEIPRGQPSTEVEVKIDPKLTPGRYNIRTQAAGFVGMYEESLNTPNLQIEVKKPGS